MCQATFLDTGVVIGYCFLPDSHHESCSEFVDSARDRHDLYVSPTVEDEYDHAKRTVSERLARAIQDHVRAVSCDSVDGTLGPSELQR